MGYIILLDGVSFEFLSEEEYRQFLKILFKFAIDRRLLYVSLVDSIQMMIGSIMGEKHDGMTIAAIERALTVLYNEYGKIYDPEKEFISFT